MLPGTRRKFAAVLIAVMTMLPLQSLMAAMAPVASDNCDHPGSASTMMMDHGHAQMTHSDKGDCCPNDAAKANIGNHQCDKSCDHCDTGGYATALPMTAENAVNQFRHSQDRETSVSQIIRGRTLLFRPPIFSV